VLESSRSKSYEQYHADKARRTTGGTSHLARRSDPACLVASWNRSREETMSQPSLRSNRSRTLAARGITPYLEFGASETGRWVALGSADPPNCCVGSLRKASGTSAAARNSLPESRRGVARANEADGGAYDSRTFKCLRRGTARSLPLFARAKQGQGVLLATGTGISGRHHHPDELPQALPLPPSRYRQGLTRRSTSVLSQKSLAKVGERSAALARRDDEGLAALIRGGATPPGAWRPAEFDKGLLGQDTR